MTTLAKRLHNRSRQALREAAQAKRYETKLRAQGRAKAYRHAAALVARSVA